MSPNLAPIRLIPLVCIKCQAPIPAAPAEVAWVCEQCGQGLQINLIAGSGDNETAASALDVFFSKDIQLGSRGRPYWVTRARVTITERTTYKGDEGRAAQEYWSVPRLFYIPAWETTLDEIIAVGGMLLKQSPAMVSGARMPFLPVVTPPGDIRALAEFIIVSVEAERRDYLKTIRFNLEFETPQLWVLP